MLESLTVRGAFGRSWTLPLGNPWGTGLAITHIDGLGSPQATINSKPNATFDGESFNSARVNRRTVNIKMAYVHVDGTTIPETRRLVYQLFPIKSWVRLQFNTWEGDYVLHGYVEQVEQEVFSAQGGCTVSVVCTNPWFERRGRHVISGGCWNHENRMLEFPLSNESLTEPKIITAEIGTYTKRVINYGGDIETGITLIMNATGNVVNPSIENVTYGQKMTFDIGKVPGPGGNAMQDGDQLYIETRRGRKITGLKRDDNFWNMINGLGRDFQWFVLHPGENEFKFSADEGIDNLEFEIRYFELCEGM